MVFANSNTPISYSVHWDHLAGIRYELNDQGMQELARSHEPFGEIRAET